MTREDRLSDIEDNGEYLDALHAHILASLGGASPTFTALGFSQGVATVARWLERTRVHVDPALLWGSTIPGHVDLAASPALRASHASRTREPPRDAQLLPALRVLGHVRAEHTGGAVVGRQLRPPSGRQRQPELLEFGARAPDLLGRDRILPRASCFEG